MGIDLGGAFTIGGVSGVQANSPALKIAGASDALVIDLTGRTTYPNQIGFIAVSTSTTAGPRWPRMCGTCKPSSTT